MEYRESGGFAGPVLLCEFWGFFWENACGRFGFVGVLGSGNLTSDNFGVFGVYCGEWCLLLGVWWWCFILVFLLLCLGYILLWFPISFLGQVSLGVCSVILRVFSGSVCASSIVCDPYLLWCVIFWALWLFCVIVCSVLVCFFILFALFCVLSFISLLVLFLLLRDLALTRVRLAWSSTRYPLAFSFLCNFVQ